MLSGRVSKANHDEDNQDEADNAQQTNTPCHGIKMDHQATNNWRNDWEDPVSEFKMA